MNKVVFISGSSRGIGAATAKRFAREGYSVVITFQTSEPEAQAVARECQKLGSPQTLVLGFDVANDKSIIEGARQVKEKFGQIDVLINNAGVYVEGLAHEQAFPVIDWQVDVNLKGPIKVVHELMPITKEAVINISSRLGTVGKKKASVYSATKWGLRGFTKSIALERKDLRVLAVHPGLTATAMGDYEGMPPETVAEVIYNSAMGNYHLKSGSDVLVRYYVLGPFGRFMYLIKEFAKKVIGR